MLASGVWKALLEDVDGYALNILLPHNTWILVDSSLQPSMPPREVVGSQRSVVYAASSRESRWHWENKYSAEEWCMRPWTLAEVIMAYALSLLLDIVIQAHTRADALPNLSRLKSWHFRQLQTFWEEYAPSVKRRMRHLWINPSWIYTILRSSSPS